MLAQKQKTRQAYERKLYLIAELQKLGHMQDYENYSLVTLEQIHINEKCRIGMTL